MSTKWIAALVTLVLIIGLTAAFVLKSSRRPVPTPVYLPPVQNTPPPTPTPTPDSEVLNPTENQILLSLTTPADKSVVTTARVTITGKTVPGAEVSINDQNTTADSLGQFQQILTLDEGENPIDIISSDSNGNSSELEITISYIPPGQ